jgi:hypothetical protein
MSVCSHEEHGDRDAIDVGDNEGWYITGTPFPETAATIPSKEAIGGGILMKKISPDMTSIDKSSSHTYATPLAQAVTILGMIV